MYGKVFAILWTILITVFVVRKWITRRLEQKRRRGLAKSLGCGQAQSTVRELPFGVDHLLRNLKADQQKVYPRMLVERQTKYGLNHTLEISVFLHTNYYTIDPANIQCVLATKFNDFNIGPHRSGNFFPLLGDGIFTSDNDAWKAHRGMLRPHFAKAEISNPQWLEKHFQNLTKGITIESDSRTATVDLLPLFYDLTFNASVEFLFGEIEPEEIQVRKISKQTFYQSFERAQYHLARRIRFDELYWLHSPADFRKTCNDVKQYLNPLVEEAFARRKMRSTPSKRYTFLQALMEDTQNVTELRDQLLHILLAGRDTTASLLSWTFYLLSRNPEVYQSLRQSILETFGSYSDPKNIDFPTIKSCQNLMHVLNETLRLFSPVPINIRFAVRDTTIPRGGGPDGSLPLLVPKGTEVVYSVHAMHRSKEYWGEDAEEFRPGRWEGRKTGWEFLPFNGGPRICLGQQFAIVEASFVTIRLVQRFERIKVLERVKDDPITYNLGLTSRPGDGVWVNLCEAASV